MLQALLAYVFVLSVRTLFLNCVSLKNIVSFFFFFKVHFCDQRNSVFSPLGTVGEEALLSTGSSLPTENYLLFLCLEILEYMRLK